MVFKTLSSGISALNGLGLISGLWSPSCLYKLGAKETSLSFSYSHRTDEYKCYSKHFNDEIIEDEFAYFIYENYEQTFNFE